MRYPCELGDDVYVCSAEVLMIPLCVSRNPATFIWPEISFQRCAFAVRKDEFLLSWLNQVLYFGVPFSGCIAETCRLSRRYQPLELTTLPARLAEPAARSKSHIGPKNSLPSRGLYV